MEKEFVPFELAVKLKELGFDELCFGLFYKTEFKLSDFLSQPYIKNSELNTDNVISTPLWQQAFDWFRNKHNNPSSISHFGRFGYSFVINYSDNRDFEYRENYNRWNYEEARQACLEKLIELTELK